MVAPSACGFLETWLSSRVWPHIYVAPLPPPPRLMIFTPKPTSQAHRSRPINPSQHISGSDASQVSPSVRRNPHTHTPTHPHPPTHTCRYVSLIPARSSSSGRMCSRTLNSSWNFFTSFVATAWVLHWATYRRWWAGRGGGGMGVKLWR